MQTGSGTLRAQPKPSWRTRLPFFYGWVVVVSLFLAQAIAFEAQYTFAVFYVALLEEFGWGRGPTAAVFSSFLIVGGFVGAAAGALIDRFGSSRVIPAGAVLMFLGFLGCSRVSALWELYLFYGVLASVGAAMSGWVPCVTMVSRWFSAKRGLAMGLASAGIGFSIVVMVPFTQYLISTLGWRTAYSVLAWLALLGIAPQSALLQVGRPQDLGLAPDGVAPGGAVPQPRPVARGPQQVVDQEWASRPWTVASAAATRRFWLLAGNSTLSTLTNQMMWVHQVAFLVDGGYARMLAASVMGLAGFLSMPGKVLWGNASDRWGREVTFAAGVSLVVLSIGLLLLTRTIPGLWLVALFALVYPAGYSVAGSVAPAASADIFAGRRFGAIYGVVSVPMGFGGAFGAWFAGFIYDATGSYLAAFGTAVACSVTSAVSLWLAAPRKVRRPGRK